MARSEIDRLVLRRTLAAPPATVFELWTTPDHMKAWFAPSDTYTNPFIEVDLCEGGAYRIAFLSEDGQQSVVGGRYVTVNPPAKLAFTWQWESPHDFDGHETLVTVDFLACESGTELVLTHERFPNDAMRSLHSQGWAGTLDRLVRAAS